MITKSALYSKRKKPSHKRFSSAALLALAFGLSSPVLASGTYNLRAVKEPLEIVDSTMVPKVQSPAQLLEKQRTELCDKELGASQIRVWESVEPLVVKHTKSIAELSKLAPEYDKSANILGRTNGVLDAKFRLKSEFLTKTYEHFSCMKPSIDVTLTLSDFSVDIAKEFAPATCSFNHILKHEYRHVAVNQATLHRAAVQLSTALHQEFDHKIYFGMEPATKNALNDRFKTYWAPYVKELLRLGLEENKAIDSPQEYQENRTACDGAIRTIVEHSRMVGPPN